MADRSKTPLAAPADSVREGGDGRLLPSREGGDEGSFISRWSRRKKEAREQPVEKAGETPSPVDAKPPVPDLPAPESLTFDSDYRQFFHPGVDEDMRRAALKKLFSDPRFNVMDGLDVYIDDYSRTEPIPAAMLAGLKQAQNIFQWAKEDAEERRKAEAGAENATQDVGVDAAPESLEARSDAPDVPDVRASEPAPVSRSVTESRVISDK